MHAYEVEFFSIEHATNPVAILAELLDLNRVGFGGGFFFVRRVLVFVFLIFVIIGGFILGLFPGLFFRVVVGVCFGIFFLRVLFRNLDTGR